MKIQKIIQLLTFTPLFSFCDLIGQNRLGNNLWLMKQNRAVQQTSKTFALSLLIELTKTESGRNRLHNFMKGMSLSMRQRKINKAGRYGRRFRV